MKKTLLCLSLGLLVAGSVQAQTYVSEDFNSVSTPSLPTGWVSSPSGLWQTGAPDNVVTNGETLAGTSFNDPAHMNAVGINGNTNANNAILETPSFSIPGSASNVYLTFDVGYGEFHLTSNPNMAEHLYLVYSTNGGSTWTNIQEITAGQTLWQHLAISLSSLIGTSNLRLGFKYENSNTQLVGAALDNIMIYIAPTNEMGLVSASPQQGDPASFGAVGGTVNISGTVQNNGLNAITSYTVHVQEGNNTPTSTTESANIASFQSGTFSDASYTVPSIGAHNLKVWVTLNGDNNHSNDSATAYVEGVSFMPAKRLVLEEATGTWCGWCPRGHVGMDELAAQYPGMATQIAVHDEDPMTITAYDQLITHLPGFSGFPSIVVDRRLIGDPGDIISLYTAHENDFGYATVSMGTPSVSGSSVSVDVTVAPAVNINNAKLALVVTESNIRHADQSNPPSYSDTLWMQHNYYSPQMPGGPNQGGNIQLPLTGFDHASEYVDGMYYNFVARAASPSPAGAASGLPAAMTAGSTYDATLSANLDPSWNTADLQYDVLLIGSDGSILNSAGSTTPTLNPILSDTVGAPNSIANVKLGINSLNLFPNPVTTSSATLSFNMSKNAQLHINIVDMTGRVVYSTDKNVAAGNSSIQLPTGSLSNGTYFLTVGANQSSSTIKFAVTK